MTATKTSSEGTASAPETAGLIPMNSPTYIDAANFLFTEADLLDELQYDAWLALLAEDLRYTVPLRQTRSRADQAQSVVRTMKHFDDNYLSIKARIDRLNTNSAWAEDPPSRTRRFVSNIRVYTTDVATELAVKSYLLLSRNRYEHSSMMFISGVRHDRIRRHGEGFKLVSRDVIIDQSVLGMPNLGVFL
ncbi:MAG: 3-phenylpropionate/cinnamic acid dioxygenase subunit beta [Porticoccaceae bacterium]|jgi:3-phenylpropionate/cinnamic acid dioxygenase small subunit